MNQPSHANAKLSLAAFALLAATSAQADTVFPTQTLVVSDSTTRSSLGTVDTGTLSGEFVVRGQSSIGQDNAQLASFMQFDIPLPAFVTSMPDFAATFRIDYIAAESSVAGGAVSLGVNQSGSWDATGSNNPLFDWGRDDEDAVVVAAVTRDLVAAVNGSAPPVIELEIDVTDIAKAWILDPSSNQGLVLFMDSDTDQGAVFTNAEIEITYLPPASPPPFVPEPGSLALLAMGGLMMARRRRG